MRNSLINSLNNKYKKIILLTSEFPYGIGETFLENEFPFLSNGFENIVIFSESNKGESRINKSSAEVNLLTLINWKSRIRALFSKIFYFELNYLRNERKLSFSTIRTAWYSLSKAISIAEQLKAINEKECAIFYSYWLDEKALALALLKKKYSNLKAISRAHGWDVYEERHPNDYLPYRNLLAENLDAIYTISENGKSYLSDRYPKLKHKIQLSRLGTMPLKLIPVSDNIEQFHILSISSVIPLKRVDKILDVVSSVTNFKIKWTHIGNGTEFEKIKELAIQKSRLNQNFSFDLTGHLTNTAVREILASRYFNLFINLSETEGIPVSIMEAQSAGIPVLATNIGGTPEIVNDENGFLVDKNLKNIDLNELLNKITKIVELRQMAFESWKRRYNAEINFQLFVDKIKHY